MYYNDFVQQLISAYIVQNAAFHRLENKLSSLETEMNRLKELIALQQKRRFGKKSEASSPEESEPTPEATTLVAAHQRKKKKGRLLDTSNLPRYSVIHDLSESEKICRCCQNNLHEIGKDISEQIEIIPQQYSVIEHIRLKYACRKCDTVHMAPKPFSPLPKSIAGASFIADVLVNKYHLHLPLYRQSANLKSHGLNIPDNTLGNWVMRAGEALFPVLAALWKVVLATHYLQVDETPVKILEPDKNGYLWTYYAPNIAHKGSCGLVVFEMSETRSGSVAEARLKDFTGVLQTDGYSGYSQLRTKKEITACGCFTHARRKFDEVVKISGDTNGIAAEMLNRMKPLYALEARMRENKNMHFRTRKNLRQRIARPITKEIYKWLKSVQPMVPPKSQLGKAIAYTMNQWKYLIAYINHGEAEIDTNYVENKIRPIALGRKNWLFMKNEDSGKIHALFYSLTQSCIMNDLNPRVYLHFLLTKVHDIRKGTTKPEDLLPDRIDKKALKDFVDDQIVFAKKVLNII